MEQTARFAALPAQPELIIALGGGSVIELRKSVCGGWRRFHPSEDLSRNPERCGTSLGYAADRSPHHGGHRQRSHLLGNGVGRGQRQEVFAGAAKPLPQARGGRSAPDAGQAARAHGLHRSRCAVASRWRALWNRERQSGVCQSRGPRRARRPRGAAEAGERPRQYRAAHADGDGGRPSRALPSPTPRPRWRIRCPTRSR